MAKHPDAFLRRADQATEVQSGREKKVAIRGKIHKAGVNAIVQQRLMAIFDCAMDAFVYIDIDGGETITFNELQLGFKRLGLTGAWAEPVHQAK